MLHSSKESQAEPSSAIPHRSSYLVGQQKKSTREPMCYRTHAELVHSGYQACHWRRHHSLATYHTSELWGIYAKASIWDGTIFDTQDDKTWHFMSVETSIRCLANWFPIGYRSSREAS
ncbi:uncharacterized protein MCYG_01477 [Microsporum canis CBS 113480]|uniref:Uncharacterized protein n=1 Tax=Arthroderma otae (strain ATCC MYA-4605 / CBS 113480) TaxID=554155 RepID=C5FH28_ARTOC|nr:uncharacterized protein MCYG_01477 [Microsporum canis CBS 113480]EEQ28658.1 predicted protein [Microsporum canis CBS 113480]